MFERGNASQWIWSTDAVEGAFAAAYAKFRAALQNAWPSPEAETLVSQAFEAYVVALQHAGESPERAEQAASAYRQFQQRLHDTFAATATRDALRDAYRTYVTDLQRAWAGLNPSAMTAESLGTVAQSIGWVAAVAAQLEHAFASGHAPSSPR